MPHHGGTLGERSLGGSETAAICIAYELARRGHQVTVFSQTPHPIGVPLPWGGGLSVLVEWRPIQHYPAYISSTPIDVLVVSRDMGALQGPIFAKHRVLWCHDLGLKRNRNALASCLWQLDAVYLLSEYQMNQYKTTFEGIPPQIFKQTRNGIRLPELAALQRAGLPRDMTKLVYASRPERGLENALEIMDILKRRGAPHQLAVCGYDNTTQHMAEMYHALWERCRQMENVVLVGALRQNELYRELATAGALIYPGVSGDFREVSCIAIMESMAVATPVIAAKRGAIIETLAPGAGIFVGGEDQEPNSREHREKFADAIQAMFSDQNAYELRQKRCLDGAMKLDWGGVADQWQDWWVEAIEQRSDNEYRLERHLRRQGDREALAWMKQKESRAS